MFASYRNKFILEPIDDFVVFIYVPLTMENKLPEPSLFSIPVAESKDKLQKSMNFEVQQPLTVEADVEVIPKHLQSPGNLSSSDDDGQGSPTPKSDYSSPIPSSSEYLTTDKFQRPRKSQTSGIGSSTSGDTVYVHPRILRDRRKSQESLQYCHFIGLDDIRVVSHNERLDYDDSEPNYLSSNDELAHRSQYWHDGRSKIPDCVPKDYRASWMSFCCLGQWFIDCFTFFWPKFRNNCAGETRNCCKMCCGCQICTLGGTIEAYDPFDSRWYKREEMGADLSQLHFPPPLDCAPKHFPPPMKIKRRSVNEVVTEQPQELSTDITLTKYLTYSKSGKNYVII